MLPPSSLPSWSAFNETLLAEIKECALGMPGLAGAAQAAITGLSLQQIGFTVFSEAIVKIITAEGYFPVLQALDGTQINANHQALAQLAAAGSVRAIVTTNFDTLIEQAFAGAGVPLRVAATASEYA